MNQFEQEEIKLLKNSGFQIKAKFLGKERIFTTKKMSLERLVDLSDVYIKMRINEDAVYSDDIGEMMSEQISAVKFNAKLAAKALAISVSDGWLKRKFVTWIFYKSINPTELREHTQNLIKQSDYSNFTLSIILMNGNRITKPKMIEEQKG